MLVHRVLRWGGFSGVLPGEAAFRGYTLGIGHRRAGPCPESAVEPSFAASVGAATPDRVTAEVSEPFQAGPLLPETGPVRSDKMRILLTVVMVLGSAVGQLSAQEPCLVRPRWIAVTVVGGTFTLSGQTSRVGSGARLIDRCGPSEIVYVAELGPHWRNEEAVAAYRDGARTNINMAPRVTRDDNFTTYYVKETVQDICAAMDDCGDATRP